MYPVLGERFSKLGTSHDYLKGDRAIAREAIIRDILPSAKMVNVPCLCQDITAEDILLSKIDRWGLPATNVLCSNCGLIRINPRWDDDTYSQIYRSYFWPLQMGFFEITEERFGLSSRRADSFSRFLTTHLDLTEKNLLEIGCSYGAGLSSLRESGAHLTGFDYDERCLNFGRSFCGLDLKQGGIREALREGKKYDVIILRHVLEHFLNPMEECQALGFLLKENGTLFVEVPGIFELEELCHDPLMYFNVFHIFSFTLSTLTNLMNACSFSVIFGDDHVYSLWNKKAADEKIIWADPTLAKTILNLFVKVEQNHIQSKTYKNYFLTKGRAFLGRLTKLVISK
jgi:2-polyprenyl-3-methyl-5-hydroxy-6-metoxy-1,4-benzoquinol methylase